MNEPFSLPELERIAREKKVEYPRCATCKWLIDYRDGWMPYCRNPDVLNQVLDSEGDAMLQPRPDFGCVLHQVKP